MYSPSPLSSGSFLCGGILLGLCLQVFSFDFLWPTDPQDVLQAAVDKDLQLGRLCRVDKP